jgi:CheY-like chemotaxis protein
VTTKKKILLVDDDNLTRKIYRDRLVRAGFEVVEEATGERALDRVAGGEPFDLVVLDIFMTRMTGLEVLKAIRQWVDEKELPIIAVSAYKASALKENEETGTTLYKPIPLSRLVQEAERLIGGKKCE